MYAIVYPPTRVYFLAITGEDVVTGFVEPTQCLDSGADSLEEFPTAEALNARLLLLGPPPYLTD